MNRTLASLLALLLLAYPLASSARAIERPLWRLGLQGDYSDNVSGLAVVDPQLYPLGNSNWRGTMSLGVLEDLELGAERDVLVGVDLDGQYDMPYSSFDQWVGNGLIELHAGGLLGGNAYLTYSYANFIGRSQWHALMAAADRPLFGPISWEAAAGFDWYVSNDPYANQGPLASLGLRWHARDGTYLSCDGSWADQAYVIGRVDQILGIQAALSQRLLTSTYLTLLYRHDLGTSSDPTRNLTGDEALAGTDVYF